MRNTKVIYTVITGDYDDLRQPEAILPDWDYICFNNDIPEKQVGVWEIRRFDYRNANPVRESRYPKINPHLLLSGYEYSLYADPTVVIGPQMNNRLQALVRHHAILAMIPHPERNCIYQEAMILTAWGIDEADRIYQSAKYLLQQHFPKQSGLFGNAVLFRQHNNGKIIRFSESWWKLYCRFSARDQMSAVYALHQARLTPEIMFPSSFYSKNLCPHKKKRKEIKELSFKENILRHLAIIRLKILYFRYGIGSLKNSKAGER